MKISSFKDAVQYLETFIPLGRYYLPKSKLERIQFVMSLLGDPQNKIKVIHVAGTAGKGSVCHYISHLLQIHGFKVGLTVSPHLVNIRERVQINNKMISEAKFCRYLTEIKPFIEKIKETKHKTLSYFEIIHALAYYIYFKEEVDYAVMETGMGGRYDATNTVASENKVAVLSKIGFDHTEILGDTLEKIAAEKAGIIHKHNLVISIDQRPEVEKVFYTKSRDNEARFNVVKKYSSAIKSYSMHTRFDFSYKDISIKKIELSTPALYQLENVSLALSTLIEISKRDRFQINEDLIRKTLIAIKLPGRFDIKSIKNKQIIIDGAHNPEKMSAFVKSLVTRFPNKKFRFLVSIKKGKNYKEILENITPVASKIYLCEFRVSDQGWIVEAEKPKHLAEVLDKIGFADYTIILNTEAALKDFLKHPHDINEINVITGSLYLVSQVYQIINS